MRLTICGFFLLIVENLRCSLGVNNEAMNIIIKIIIAKIIFKCNKGAIIYYRDGGGSVCGGDQNFLG